MSEPAKPLPVLEWDEAAHAAYVRFTAKPVAKTHVLRDCQPLIAVDLDRDGGVIGVEFVPSRSPNGS